MTQTTVTLSSKSLQILDELRELRQMDAPTHGGRVLSYVYDSGMAELDALADAAANITRSLNGLDPTTFPSIAAMERELIAFMRQTLHGDDHRRGERAFGTVTSGGTESCLLAVKTARDLWRSQHPRWEAKHQIPRLVAPATVHAAFHKAARLFDLKLDLAPCGSDGSVAAKDITKRLGSDVALVVLSAPSYPTGVLDPISEVAKAAKKRGISCHVDACFGGMILPWIPNLPPWDFRVPGVTSISADLHKYGYAPKGVSVLLHRGRKRHRSQFFALTKWPAYPVVNPTLLGSKSASPLASAWAITRRLGPDGYRTLTQSCLRSARTITNCVEAIPGLRVQGTPVGPAIALVADESLSVSNQVDPHHLADELATLGFKIQHQPGIVTPGGIRIPHSAHLTITPVTEATLAQFCAALISAANAVRGRPRPNVKLQVRALRLLGLGRGKKPLSPENAWRILRLAGAGGKNLPGKMAPLLALVEQLPGSLSEVLLSELLARVSEP